VANHPSAKKRYRQSLKRNERNRSEKSRLHTLPRDLDGALASGDQNEATSRLQIVSRALAKAASKGLLHRKTAARRTARLARKVARASTAN